MLVAREFEVLAKQHGTEKNFRDYSFDESRIRNVRYAVLRNYEFLPSSTGGSDLDVVVSSSDYCSAQLTLLDFMWEAGGDLLGIV